MKAISSYTHAGMWQECLNVAYSIPLAQDEIELLAHNLADALFERRQFKNAARLYLDYGRDEASIEKAVIALAKGYEFTEAIRVVQALYFKGNNRFIKGMEPRKLPSLSIRQY